LLTLEITESLFLESSDDVIPMLDQIRAQGIKMSLDDFGTGYSSLHMIRDLPIDELKIDRSFIQQMEQIRKYRAIVQVIIDLAHNLDLIVVAEGVETLSQKNILKNGGCDLMQGFLLSKPCAFDQLLEAVYKRV
jgi:EAL domain-containing protein (putative c-di-GMP-specific phosphodiesterase class I)